MSFCPKCAIKLTKQWLFATMRSFIEGFNAGPTSTVTPMYRRQEKLKRTRKQEKNQNLRKGKQKNRTWISRFFNGGLILIVIGVFALLQLSGSNYFGSGGQGLAIMLFIIGIIIILALSTCFTSRKHFLNQQSR